MGIDRSFQRGGVTLCLREGTHQVVKAFLLNVGGYLLKKGL